MSKIDKLLAKRQALDDEIAAAKAAEKRISDIARRIEKLGLAELPDGEIDAALADLERRIERVKASSKMPQATTPGSAAE